MRCRRGFTLIELLVVIAIISILASILFPVFSRARGKGRQAACISNVRQLTLAMSMYAQDYDEIIPYGQIGFTADTQWYNAIFPYTRNRQIMFCPDRKDKAPGYAMAYLASGKPLNSFWDASTKITVGDVRPEAIGANGKTGDDGWWLTDPGNNLCGAPTDTSFLGNNWPQRHNDGVIYGFADGHVKWAREEQLDTPIYWDPTQPTE
ncbi:MAG: prepilin-type N-terminal cleavage/methylation domain-containing protein [Armatimonadota bacterium]